MDLNFDGILQQYGLAIGVLIWSIYGIIRIVHNIAPEAFRVWQSARLDEQEHRQGTERNLRETQKLGAGKYIKKPLTLEKIGLAIKDELEK